jgi:hypothetical protein
LAPEAADQEVQQAQRVEMVRTEQSDLMDLDRVRVEEAHRQTVQQLQMAAMAETESAAAAVVVVSAAALRRVQTVAMVEMDSQSLQRCATHD